MKKRIIPLFLTLCLTLILAFPASAAEIRLSNQSLKVNGESAYAQAYNIDGSNYFKLRDMACLLNGTGAQFSVTYMFELNMVVIETGEAYAPIGTELDASAAETPSNVVESPQSLVIDGETVDGLSAYNIDGANYFKLRDLGAALGFGVDYEGPSRTMLVTTPDLSEAEEKWMPDISFDTVDTEGNRWTDACFKDAELTMINYWAYWCGPCVEEMPELQRLLDSYASKGLQILGIYDPIDEEDNKAVLDELGITYPCILYTQDFDGYLNTGYLPSTIFVNSEGKVVSSVYIGSTDYIGWMITVSEYLP